MKKELLVQIARTFKMKSRSSVRLMLLFVGLTSLVLLGVSQTANAEPIAAGDDVFASTGQYTITINDPFFPGGFTETISLYSAGVDATVHRDGQVGNMINTEIVSLSIYSETVRM